MSVFLKRGERYMSSSEEELDLHPKLPGNNFIIGKDEMSGQLFFQKIESFEINTKLYGDVISNTHRILTTFDARKNSTGVLLCGEKGSGKSLLAKNISVEAAKVGIPTIIINAPWVGDAFNKLIQSIEQPCIILFDEFEKVYNAEDQEEILTLLDGVFPSKKLFMLTCNDKWRVDSHMRNRPGRIFYMLDFSSLSYEFIVEYCNENLKNTTHTEKVAQIASTFNAFNFDMLKAIVEEMNRWNEAPVDALRMLNIKREFSSEMNFKVVLHINGINVIEDDLDDKFIQVNPFAEEFEISYYKEPSEEYRVKAAIRREKLAASTKAARNANLLEKAIAQPVEVYPSRGEQEYARAEFTPNDIKSVSQNGSVFTFVNNKNEKVVLTKHIERSYHNYDAF